MRTGSILENAEVRYILGYIVYWGKTGTTHWNIMYTTAKTLGIYWKILEKTQECWNVKWEITGIPNTEGKTLGIKWKNIQYTGIYTGKSQGKHVIHSENTGGEKIYQIPVWL